MANEKSKPKNYVEAVFDGMRAAEEHINAAENETAKSQPQPQPTQPIQAYGYGGFGTPTPMIYPQYGYDPQAAGFQSYMSDCCKSLIPGTTIGTYVRCTGAEFVVDNWKLGGLYRIETADHHCLAFLKKKTPELLEFSSVDDEGNNITIEIKANDLCSDFKEKTEAYPFTRMIRTPTNPIVVYPLR